MFISFFSFSTSACTSLSTSTLCVICIFFTCLQWSTRTLYPLPFSTVPCLFLHSNKHFFVLLFTLTSTYLSSSPLMQAFLCPARHSCKHFFVPLSTHTSTSLSPSSSAWESLLSLSPLVYMHLFCPYFHPCMHCHESLFSPACTFVSPLHFYMHLFILF